ncbi:hypothetical protein TWF694_003092 [Orbilia ellipsospora]|uniref:Uncharacterized protein n=1 Tax=Orbilia ellipsospora TaxID=2528407 RepID=A0AAV9X0L7_9PEZI
MKLSIILTSSLFFLAASASPFTRGQVQEDSLARRQQQPPAKNPSTNPPSQAPSQPKAPASGAAIKAQLVNDMPKEFSPKLVDFIKKTPPAVFEAIMKMPEPKRSTAMKDLMDLKLPPGFKLE